MAFSERQIFNLFRTPPALKDVSYVVEFKVSKTNSIPFNALKPHQEAALLKAQTGFLYRITDPRGGLVVAQLPFDAFRIKCDQHSYVGVLYHKPRKKKVLLLIMIEDWIAERERSTRKSLTKERAQEIAAHEVAL